PPSPRVTPDVLHEIRAEGAGRVHRGAGVGATDVDVERDGEPDGKAGDRGERPAWVRGRREDHPDQEEGQHALDHDRAAGADPVPYRRRAEAAAVSLALGQ